MKDNKIPSINLPKNFTICEEGYILIPKSKLTELKLGDFLFSQNERGFEFYKENSEYDLAKAIIEFITKE